MMKLTKTKETISKEKSQKPTRFKFLKCSIKYLEGFLQRDTRLWHFQYFFANMLKKADRVSL